MKVTAKILDMIKQGKSYREIQKEVYYWNKGSHKKFVSMGYISKVLAFHKSSVNNTSEKLNLKNVQNLTNK